MGRIIAIANQKGGVGKTTTAINLSAALAHSDKKILVIDMDPQGNTSRGFGIDISILGKSIFDVLSGTADINRVIRKTETKNVDVLPSKLLLATLDTVIAGKTDSPFSLLKSAINKIKKSYDYMFIDCPPSLGLLTINSLVAANSILIPVQCEYFAMEAVSQMLGTVSRVQASHNPDLGIEGFLLTMYDSRASLCTEVSMQIRGLFKENTFVTQIPRNISIPESNAKGMPVITFRPTSSGSLAYLALAREIIDKDNQTI